MWGCLFGRVELFQTKLEKCFHVKPSQSRFTATGSTKQMIRLGPPCILKVLKQDGSVGSYRRSFGCCDPELENKNSSPVNSSFFFLLWFDLIFFCWFFDAASGSPFCEVTPCFDLVEWTATEFDLLFCWPAVCRSPSETKNRGENGSKKREKEKEENRAGPP